MSTLLTLAGTVLLGIVLAALGLYALAILLGMWCLLREVGERKTAHTPPRKDKHGHPLP